VTDAISALGLEEGTHQLGQLAIEVKGGRALVAGTETLCGSIANMNQCIQFFMKAACRYFQHSISKEAKMGKKDVHVQYSLCLSIVL
jgi:N-acetylglucosamine-6-phosphate deacetylase